MATFQRLGADAFTKSAGRPRNSYLEEYTGFLSTIEVNEGGEIVLDASDKKATIKNRLNHAARTLERELRYFRTSPQLVRFQVVQ